MAFKIKRPQVVSVGYYTPPLEVCRKALISLMYRRKQAWRILI
jgi:hypothetical protein